jgi:hypothetical protein
MRTTIKIEMIVVSLIDLFGRCMLTRAFLLMNMLVYREPLKEVQIVSKNKYARWKGCSCWLKDIQRRKWQTTPQ